MEWPYETSKKKTVEAVRKKIKRPVSHQQFEDLCNFMTVRRCIYLSIYRKIPKYSDTRIIAVIILKFEQCGSTIESWVQKMQPEWQIV